MKVMLNQLLDQKGISQNKIAKDTGISTTTLRNLNHNRTTTATICVSSQMLTQPTVRYVAAMSAPTIISTSGSITTTVLSR